MGQILGVLLGILMVFILAVSLFWVMFTKKWILKFGILRFLLATIVWNGALLGIYVLIWKVSNLSVVFYEVPSGWVAWLVSVIYTSYKLIMNFGFPIYTAIVIIYGIFEVIRKKGEAS